MPYIYKITNKKNGKVYVGQTTKDVKERFKWHCQECKRDRSKNRPLYIAMRKYGVEIFEPEEIEQCEETALSERERYWIENLGSFKFGYNATYGGDGRPCVDRDLILKLWGEKKSALEIQRITGYDPGTISSHLEHSGVGHDERRSQGMATERKPVAMLDPKTMEMVKAFDSVRSAYNYIGDTGHHIPDACKGKRKTVKGYAWKYI